MSDVPPAAAVFAGNRQVLEACVARFEADLRSQPVTIDAALATAPAELRSTLLVELVHAELDFRIKQGQAVTVDDYLGRFPELSALPERAAELRAAENRLRTRNVASSPLFDVPAQLNRFVIHETIGQGAFGIVYRATDARLRRSVALKLPRPGRIAAPADVERFLREARHTAQLRHPNIVPIHEWGESGGTVFLVSDLIVGRNLAERIAAASIEPRQAASWTLALAEALGHAHTRGIIHRDLKPSNILIDHDGEPYLTDFGLSKHACATTLTLDGQALGTPAYMAPELAAGAAHTADERCDVYGLGVILYEMLTGMPPFRGDARMVLLQIQEVEPWPPRRLNDRIPRDLETICLTAIAKDPRSRFVSAAEFAADLRRFLEGQPIRSRRADVWRRAVSYARRRPLVAGLGASLIILVVLGLVGAAWHLGQLERARARYEQVYVQSESALNQILDVAQINMTSPAESAWRQEQLRIACNHFRRLVSDGSDQPSDDATTHAWYSLGRAELYLGNTARGRQALEAAERRGEARLLQRNDDDASTALLAEIHHRLSLIAPANATERDVCLAHATRACDLSALRTGKNPALAGPRIDLATHSLGRGALLRAAGRQDEAGTEYAAAAAAIEPLASPSALGTLEPRRRVDVIYLLGQAARGADRIEEAVTRYQQALTLYKTIPEVAGGAPPSALLWQTAECRFNLATMLRRRRQAREALAIARVNVEEWRALAREHPSLLGVDASLAHAVALCGGLHSDLNEMTPALACFEEAAGRYARINQDHPGATALKRAEGGCVHSQARVLHDLGRNDEAVVIYRRALSLREGLRQAEPANATDRSDEAGTWSRLSEALLALRRLPEARDAALRSIEVQQSAVAAEPANAARRQVLARYRLTWERLEPNGSAPAHMEKQATRIPAGSIPDQQVPR